MFLLNEDWQQKLKGEMQKPYYLRLSKFVEEEYSTKTCFPPKEDIFNALNACSFENTKVVIIGQDPYHGHGQANGLAFSVNHGIALPPSLRNLYKELKNDLNLDLPISGNLISWAKQGVLLLNDTLTVEKAKAGSHQNQGWSEFTDAILEALLIEKTNLVVMLWGNFAQKKGRAIDPTQHCILKAKHPSPLSANRGGWFNQNHFSKTNAYLRSKGKTEINWNLFNDRE